MPHLALVGATGAVGQELLGLLASRQRLRVDSLRLLASPRSAGQRIPFQGRELIVEALDEHSFAGVDIAFFVASGAVSRHYVPAARAAGALVIDNSSAFRLDPEVPLVVPEINPEALRAHRGLIANPNCSTIIALLPVAVIDRLSRVRRMQVATYQAASGAGAAGMAELEAGTRAALAGQAFAPQVFAQPYAFNLFSHNSALDPLTGHNEEELKLVHESRKILGRSDLRIGATCIRVPVLRAHAEAITVECEQRLEIAALRAALAAAPGIRLVDERAANRFPTPLEASGQDAVLVGRLRHDLSDPSGHSISLFVAGDQLLKGAALNAVQIAEGVGG